MKNENELKNFKTYCVICKRRIPMKRHRRRAITCNATHQKRLTRLRKLERDSKKCSHCGKPMTAKQQTQFREFKAWSLTHGPDQAKKNHKAAKGIRKPAKAIHPMSEFAYVVPERPKKGSGKLVQK